MIKQTREELNKMTDKQLLALDITTKAEEEMIQEIRNSRINPVTNVVKFNNSKVPDFKNPEEEAAYQDKIDKFYKENIPVEAQIAQAEKVLESVKEEVATIPTPVDVVPETPVEAQIISESSVKAEVTDLKAPFCDSCTSKGVTHLKVCPKNPKNLTATTQPTTENK